MGDTQICISFWGTNNDLLSSAAHAALFVLGRAQVAPSTVLIVAEEATNLVVSSKPTDTRISPTKLLVTGKQTLLTVK